MKQDDDMRRIIPRASAVRCRGYIADTILSTSQQELQRESGEDKRVIPSAQERRTPDLVAVGTEDVTGRARWRWGVNIVHVERRTGRISHLQISLQTHATSGGEDDTSTL